MFPPARGDMTCDDDRDCFIQPSADLIDRVVPTASRLARKNGSLESA
jgi:hypothetical protein